MSELTVIIHPGNTPADLIRLEVMDRPWPVDIAVVGLGYPDPMRMPANVDHNKYAWLIRRYVDAEGFVGVEIVKTEKLLKLENVATLIVKDGGLATLRDDIQALIDSSRNHIG